MTRTKSKSPSSNLVDLIAVRVEIPEAEGEVCEDIGDFGVVWKSQAHRDSITQELAAAKTEGEMFRVALAASIRGDMDLVPRAVPSGGARKP